MTAFQQPGQASTPGAPVYPAKPLTGDLPGPGVPDLHRHDRRRRARADADQEGPRGEHVRRPGRRDCDADPVAGPVADAGPVLAVRARDQELHDGLEPARTSRGCCSTPRRSPCSARSRPWRRRRSSPTASPGSASRAGTSCSSILLATIILPFQVTLIPTYIIFTRLGWNGTWLPLIVPHLFANAYNVFLLRQYFMTIPRDLDEAALIDGAGPFRVFRSVIVPLSIPAIIAVSLFHFFFAWNDFFVPLLYLAGKPDLQPLSIGDPAVQRALLDPADAHPGRGAHDDGRAGRDLLPRPALLHAGRRRDRRREVGVV